ncbi:hypothetical protein EJB05_17986 [Eragrostis curvula]|uniref:DNA topoisomerase 2 n=1 Tax=Eragrostis curvula TaxID=38414 RepID=A0A5J9VIV9_9POAL|nr:hypothetical protein EJB05_17986 [Eragrostis curvula]
MELQPPSMSAHNSAAAGGVGETLRERILLAPDLFIGSVKKRTQKLWLYEGGRFTQRKVRYVPGLLKIFDDILVYAAGNNQHEGVLRVDVDAAKCRISVYTSRPIELHREEGVYVPEMIFGHLSNDDCNVEDEITGVKLANIFSTEFIVETADGPGQKKCKQIFSENMGKKSEPQVTGYRKGVNWTIVTFKPDLAKFNMTHLEDDAVALMKKRVLDMVGILGDNVQVVFNGEKIPLHLGFSDNAGFSHYAFLYIWLSPKSLHLPWICEKVNDQWEVCVSLSGGQFQQVSFVNKFATTSGGTHVDYVTNLIVDNVLSSEVFKKYNIGKHDVKRHLWLFINVYMDNPTFDSPTKETLITRQEDFGSECALSDLFFKKVRSSHLETRLFPAVN